MKVREAIDKLFGWGKHSSSYKQLEKRIEEDKKNIAAVVNAPVVIGEPASLIIEATKDVGRWKMSSCSQSRRILRTFTDKVTQEAFEYEYNETYLINVDWATPDEKQALLNAFLKLKVNLEKEQAKMVEEKKQEQAAQDKQRLLKLYKPEENNQ